MRLVEAVTVFDVCYPDRSGEFFGDSQVRTAQHEEGCQCDDEGGKSGIHDDHAVDEAHEKREGKDKSDGNPDIEVVLRSEQPGHQSGGADHDSG